MVNTQPQDHIRPLHLNYQLWALLTRVVAEIVAEISIGWQTIRRAWTQLSCTETDVLSLLLFGPLEASVERVLDMSNLA